MDLPADPAKLDLPEAAQDELLRVMELPRLMLATTASSTAPRRALILGAGAGADMIALDPRDIRVLKTWVAGE